jgi:hypothetical protein
MEHIEKNTGGSWVVYRQDDNGKRFIVRAGLGHDEAVRLADELGRGVISRFTGSSRRRDSR